ncbi:MAG: hypothetical protein FWB94_09085 [Chitinispirillia bacterium]|nr:hypothetical protein [Chitinispirillia bacterium]
MAEISDVLVIDVSEKIAYRATKHCVCIFFHKIISKRDKDSVMPGLDKW